MTLDDFKDVYKDKTPLEKLRLLLVQTDIIRGDARNQESAKWRCNDEEAAYWRNEIHAMEERIQWLYDQLAPLLKAQEPVDAIVIPNGIDRSGGWWFQCPSCKMEIEPRGRYCKSCGQAVKWE